jgi:serine protease Do
VGANTTLGAVVVLVGLTAAACGQNGQQKSEAPPAPQTPAQVTATPPSPPAPSGPAAGFADVVERLSPSVVTVRTGDGVGSAVVFRPDIVLTNAHVVGRERDVTLTFADREEAKGSVLASDPITDLAVVRSARDNLPVPEYRTELPRPGEWAVAIGSPLGLENTVTVGVISGINRAIPGGASQSQSLVDLIQTDAPISPGNSGGALLDAAGRVVGINEAYIPPEAGAVSLGFAIPAVTATDAADQLLEDGKVSHPYLGISIGRVTPAIQRQLGLKIDGGALVTGVDRGAPAARAGLKPGDVIVEVGSQPVRTLEDLLTLLRQSRPGAEIKVTYVRGGQRQEASVTVGSR